ncbi:MAG: hypothetical protein Q9227_002111 [Pyrenula ochraceoflavens]
MFSEAALADEVAAAPICDSWPHKNFIHEVVKLSYAIVLYRFFDNLSYVCLRDPPVSLSNGFFKRGSSLVKITPDLALHCTVLAAIRGEAVDLGNGHLAPPFMQTLFGVSEEEFRQAASPNPVLVLNTDPRRDDLVEIVQGTSSEIPKHDLLLSINLTKPTADGLLAYNSARYSDFEAQNVARAFSTALESAVDDPKQGVHGIDICSKYDRMTIDSWNRKVLHAEESCLHHLIENVAQEYPHKPAIVSQEGEMDYRKFNSLASRLASYLVTCYGLKPGQKVALCFEKSQWAIVAMFAVLKTGAAYCCLDPAHPETRHQFIVDSIKASIVIASPAYKDLVQQYSNVLHVDADFCSCLPDIDKPVCSRVGPDDVCLISFTSGSTGTPKGIVHTHITMCTGIVENAPRQRLAQPDTRVFQWAAYTFDVSLTEIYAPLTHGGCMCIPSEEERLNDVESAINRMKCEWAFFTPSFSRFFRRYRASTLRTIVMGGEALLVDDIQAWFDRVRVLQAFGPAECITWFIKEFTESSPSVVSCGRPSNIHGWIVDSEDSDILLPLGAVGELLIEGPAVFLEYLNDKARTQASLIEPPSWRASVGALSEYKIYKSGDLVRYLPNGEMAYVGRKDAMVKLRGQRIEVAEIEALLRINLEDTSEVAVDLIVPSGRNCDQVLVAFIRSRDEVAKLAQFLQEQIRKSLPEFMVPRIYYPVESFTYNASRKLDRKALRQFACALTLDELLQYQKGSDRAAKTMNKTLTPIQLQLRALWAQLLQIEPQNISLDDNFFALGGSSLTALRLSASGREHSILIKYADIFRGPSLQEMASNVKNIDAQAEVVPEPFIMLPSTQKSNIIQDAMVQCRVLKSEIEDIFPLTPQQEGLWALSLASGGSYVAHFPIRLRGGIEPNRFRAAWQNVVVKTSFMRSRIIQSQAGSFQVVLKSIANWRYANSAEQYIQADLKEVLDFGEPLTRYAFIKEQHHPYDSGSSENLIVWTSHHALYDGHSIPLFLNAVAKEYGGETFIPAVPFSAFVQHLQSPDEDIHKDYWRSRYQVEKAINFPKVPFPTYRPRPSGLFNRCIQFRQPNNSSITKANILRAALALTIAQLSGASHVNYLETFDGRSASVPQIEAIMGPTFATVPRNAIVNLKDSIGYFLAETQRTSAEMMTHAQYGLQNIRYLSPECAAACEFQTILVIEPEYCVEYTNVFDFDESGGGIHRFNSDCVMWKCNMNDVGVSLMASFDDYVISESQLISMAEIFEENIHFLCNKDQSISIDSGHITSSTPKRSFGKQNHISRAPLEGSGHIISPIEPSDKVSNVLKKVWVDVLAISAKDLTASSDFFLQGGNSIRAMEFVAAARRAGVSVSVAHIFQYPIYRDLVKVAIFSEKDLTEIMPPFSLLGYAKDTDAILAEAASRCDVSISEIEDILPTTPLQSEFIASSQKKTGAWMAQIRYRIAENVSVEEFQSAWNHLSDAYRILRTQIIYSKSHGTFQVILKPHALTWHKAENIKEYLDRDRSTPMRYGDPLTRYALISPAAHAPSERPVMILSIHHSLYDAFTLEKLHTALNDTLSGNPIPTTPSSNLFIKQIHSTEHKLSSKSFWQTYLSSCAPQPSTFPAIQSSTYTPKPDSTQTIHLKIPSQQTQILPSTITLPTTLLAAWSFVLNSYISPPISTPSSLPSSPSSSSITFGLRLSGRSPQTLPLLQPTITHTPHLTTLHPNDSIPALLTSLQSTQSTISSHGYDHVGLQSISSFDEHCAAACAFQCMLVIQQQQQQQQRSATATAPETGAGAGAGAAEELLLPQGAAAAAKRLVIQPDDSEEEELAQYKYFNDWALLVDCYPSLPSFPSSSPLSSRTPARAGGGGQVKCIFSYDSRVLSERVVGEMGRRFDGVLGRLVGAGEGVKVGEVIDGLYVSI